MRGSRVRRDRVRKSSGGIDVRFMFENDFAAFRNARNEAVKFDLKADLSGRNAERGSAGFSWLVGLSSNTLKSNSSTLGLGIERGCCSRSPGGEDTGVMVRLVGRILRPLGGVWGESPGDVVPVA